MKIIATVPTYNRPDLLLKNIECLINQTFNIDKIIIVDNASEPETYKKLVASGYLDRIDVIYHRIEVNSGASGGFKKGMELALELNPDWVWGMDDDAFPMKNALAELINKINEFNSKTCFWCNCDEDNIFESGYKEVDRLIFVGFFLPNKLIQEIGFPDERFHMYHDDTEYSKRIIDAGYKIIKVENSIIDHKGFDKRGLNPFLEYNFLGKKFTLLNSEGFRIYYIYRNQFYISDGTKLAKVKYYKYMIISLIKFGLFQRKNFFYVMLAFYHIIIGKRGKVL